LSWLKYGQRDCREPVIAGSQATTNSWDARNHALQRFLFKHQQFQPSLRFQNRADVISTKAQPTTTAEGRRAEAAAPLDSLHCISVGNLLNGIFVGGSKYLKEVT
jgi:hypothetical protein